MTASLTLRIVAVLIVTGGLGFSSQTAWGQPAQVVQLPTFNSFSVSTTVSVPDRGAVSLGGVRSLREGANTRGVPMLSKLPGLSRLGKNRAIGREAGASSLTAHATIISFEEMEEELLAKAAAARITDPAMLAFRESIAEAGRISSGIASASRAAAVPSPAPHTRSTPPGVAAIRRRNALASRAKMDEAMQYFKRAEEAMNEGKPGVAKIYYRLASKSGNAELRAVVGQRMEQLQRTRSDQRVR